VADETLPSLRVVGEGLAALKKRRIGIEGLYKKRTRTKTDGS
jgi:hypothetical protein